MDIVNASFILSAAQSTILAMSIFLALNKSQNGSKLSLIGIDDPLQNLDDINECSFIDVMSNLMVVENRQILISTHDSDFAKLTVTSPNFVHYFASICIVKKNENPQKLQITGF